MIGLKIGLTSIKPIIFNINSGEDVWTPADLGSSLALWLDADDASTITLNGSTVSQWRDKSGNSRHANQTVATSQPAYTTAGLNGRNVLTFDGTNDLFQLSSGILLDDNFTHVHSVLVRATTGRQTVDVGRTTTPIGYGNWWFSDNVLYSNLRGSNFMVHGGSTATGTFINGLVRNNSGTQAYRNGTAFGAAAGAAVTGNVTLNAVGRAQGSNAAVHNGIMAEVIVGRSNLSTDDRQKIEGYLAWKWGLQANLPVNHPYRYDGTLFGYYKLWTPAEISTALWLDAADASTITLNGSTVSQWRDKSENSRHVNQPTASKQPTYTLASQNGLNVISFDGNNRSLFTNAATITLNQPVHRFIVCKFLTKTFNSVVFDSDTQSAPFFFYNGESPGGKWVWPGGSYGTSDITSNHIHYHLFNNTASYYSTDGATPSGPVSAGTNTLQGVRIGHLRAEFVNGYAFQGYVYEVLLVQGTLSDADRQKLEGYLAWKWGTVASLPSDHPFKNNPPTI